MLHSGKKNCALRDKKNKYSNSCVVGKFFFEGNKKTYPPPSPSPCMLNGRSLKALWFYRIQTINKNMKVIPCALHLISTFS